MATYKEIFVKQVKFLSSDPDNEGEGQVWYNSTSDTFKTVVSSGAWSSSAPINTVRTATGSLGTQTASLMMGGAAPPYPTPTAAVEEYNGSGWRTETSIPAATQGGAGAGTTTAGLFAAGFISPPQGQNTSFEYDGSTWTATAPPGFMALGRTNLGSGGTQTAAVVYGGSGFGSPGGTNATEEYNGTAWSTANVMGSPRYSMEASNVGLQTATLAIGGSSYIDTVEEYDGTNWTATTVLPAASSAQSRYGTTTAAVAAGGGPIPVLGTKVVNFDGTTWTSTPDMATARYAHGGAGTTTAGVVAGAQPFLSNTEEYNVGTTVVVPGAWASGGALNTGRTLGGSAVPSQNAGVVFGGSPYTDVTESYNGSAWTTVPGTLNTPRGYMSGFGTEIAAVCAGGYTTPAPGISNVEEYNGSSWSEETNFPVTLLNAGNCGTMTAGLLMGGSTQQPFTSGLLATSQEYDGSSWTAGGSMATAKGQGMTGGVQTAAVYAGGRFAPAYTATTVEYNGTAFSSGGDLSFGAGPPVGFQGSIGTLTAGLAASGLATMAVNTYDGTNWSTSPSYTQARDRGMSGGTQAAAIIIGGTGPGFPYTGVTEEFTGATTAANYKTITTS